MGFLSFVPVYNYLQFYMILMIFENLQIELFFWLIKIVHIDLITTNRGFCLITKVGIVVQRRHHWLHLPCNCHPQFHHSLARPQLVQQRTSP